MPGNKKNINYNYAFLFYDVNEKRVQKVFKTCKKYLSHFQYSVFRGEMTPSKFIKLRNDLDKVIDKNEDFVCIIKLMNDNVFGEEILGSPNKKTGEDLIL
jgi:CRISPR-associated endoribonuclease Cas2